MTLSKWIGKNGQQFCRTRTKDSANTQKKKTIGTQLSQNISNQNKDMSWLLPSSIRCCHIFDARVDNFLPFIFFLFFLSLSLSQFVVGLRLFCLPFTSLHMNKMLIFSRSSDSFCISSSSCKTHSFAQRYFCSCSRELKRVWEREQEFAFQCVLEAHHSDFFHMPCVT